jgi:adenylyltransferase/sulfurtransferase
MTLTIDPKEGRFARFEAIEWWDQARLAATRVLVIGAGALGNEVVKNLALLGVGHVAIADMDCVELSNLSRSVLFGEADEGRPKAECAARAAREIFADMRVYPIVGNVLADVGLGWFRWAEVVIGALDNREARVFVNSACARVGRPWFDGGIEVLHGVVRGFAPPRTACYECTMSAVDWDLLNKRRSCSLLARRALANRGTPTTPTTASVIAAIQVQEVVKYLHGRSALLGRGFVFDGAEHNSYGVTYPVSPDCPWHEPAVAVASAPRFDARQPLRAIWEESERRLGGVDAIDFAREIVATLECPECRRRRDVFQPAEKVHAELLRCPECRAECTPAFLHSIDTGQAGLLARTPAELGLPRWEIVWARWGAEMLGWEIADDAVFQTSS